MLKEMDANAEDQTGLPSGADGAEDTRQASEWDAKNCQIFGDDGQLDSAEAQSADDLMKVAGCLARGDFEDLSDEDLAKIQNPALRAKLQGKALEAKQAAEIRAQDIAMRQQAWDRGDVICQVAGTKLNSRQVDNILRMMADPQQKAKLVDKFSKQEGISKPEAEKKLDQAARTLEVVKKKELDPNAALTPQEQTDYDRRNDPKLAPAITFLEKQEREASLDFAVKEVKTASAERNIASDVSKGLFKTSETAATSPLIQTDVPFSRDFERASSTNGAADTEPALAASTPSRAPAPVAASSAKTAAASWG